MRRRYRAILCDLFGTLVDGNGIAVDGATEFLEHLAGLRWAVVTSCGTNFALRLLRQARLPLPQILVSADDVAETKPSPACYVRAAELLRVRPEACLVIEDSSSGVEAGKAAGMDVIAIARRGRTTLRADKTIEELRQLKFEADRTGEIVLVTADE